MFKYLLICIYPFLFSCCQPNKKLQNIEIQVYKKDSLVKTVTIQNGKVWYTNNNAYTFDTKDGIKIFDKSYDTELQIAIKK